jgi:hypothetical protein
MNSDSESKPETILAADREAPVGWVRFYAYSDSTFEYSLDARDKHRGKYHISRDTLFLESNDTNIGIDKVIIKGDLLEFVGDKSPRFAGITINKIRH